MNQGYQPYDNMPVSNCAICGYQFEPHSNAYFCQCGSFFHVDCGDNYPNSCPICGTPAGQGRYKIKIGLSGKRLKGGGVLVSKKKKLPMIRPAGSGASKSSTSASASSGSEEKKAPCPNCSADMKYIEKYGRYYCYECKSYAPTGYKPPEEKPKETPKVEAKPAAGAGGEEKEVPCPTCDADMKYIEKYSRYYCYDCKSYAPTGYTPPSKKPAAAGPEVAARPAASTQTPATQQPQQARHVEETKEPTASCPSCGEEMKYIDQYDRYYCYSCKSYAPTGYSPAAAKVAAKPKPTPKPTPTPTQPVTTQQPAQTQAQPQPAAQQAQQAQQPQQPQQAQPASDTNAPCPTCSGEMKYIDQYDRYYCYECGAYAPTSYTPPSAGGAQPQAATATTTTGAQQPAGTGGAGAPTEQTSAEPRCPTCNEPLNWIEQYKRYYCYNCKTYASASMQP